MDWVLTLIMLFWRIGNTLNRSLLFRPMALGIQFCFRVITGAHLPVSIKCGRNLKLAYGGAGLVVHKDCNIGNDVLLSPGVVIGGRVGRGVPSIGNNVRIMPGAKILGDVFISDGTFIGVNAVVIQDTDQGSVWVAPLARKLDDKHQN